MQMPHPGLAIARILDHLLLRQKPGALKRARLWLCAQLQQACAPRLQRRKGLPPCRVRPKHLPVHSKDGWNATGAVFRLRQPRRRNPRRGVRALLQRLCLRPSGKCVACLSGASEAAQRDAGGNARHARQRQPANQSGPFQTRLQGASVLMCAPAAAWRAVALTGSAHSTRWHPAWYHQAREARSKLYVPKPGDERLGAIVRT